MLLWLDVMGIMLVTDMIFLFRDLGLFPVLETESSPGLGLRAGSVYIFHSSLHNQFYHADAQTKCPKVVPT